MRLAVIDCGTNTFNLIIIELLDHKKYVKLYHTRIPVKLGEEAINKGFIAKIPFARGIEAVNAIMQQIRKFNVEKTLAFATSAIRDASNGEEFVKEVRETLDIAIQVIDGDREAELIYYGIKEAVKLGNEISLIMDIGGGSNEFILADHRQIYWKGSFRIGAARVLEMFPHSDPIMAAEKASIENYLKEELKPLFEAAEKFRPAELIGSSGAFESLIEMIHGELDGEPLSSDKTEYEVDPDAHFRISGMVMQATLAERKKIKGLVPMRFDMIVISCIMVDFILRSFRLKKMRVSTYSLKEGALMEYIDKLNK